MIELYLNLLAFPLKKQTSTKQRINTSDIMNKLTCRQMIKYNDQIRANQKFREVLQNFSLSDNDENNLNLIALKVNLDSFDSYLRRITAFTMYSTTEETKKNNLQKMAKRFCKAMSSGFRISDWRKKYGKR